MTEIPDPVARYVSLGKTKEKLVPLAFTISDDTPAKERTSISVGWTLKGFDAFRAFRKAIGGPDNERSLPHRALIALLEMYVPPITRLESGAGLRDWKPRNEDVVRFAWTDAPLKRCKRVSLRLCTSGLQTTYCL